MLTKLRQTSITFLFFCREASAITQVLSWTIPVSQGSVEVLEAFLSGAMAGSNYLADMLLNTNAHGCLHQRC